jgi:hypothetical protein
MKEQNKKKHKSNNQIKEQNRTEIKIQTQQIKQEDNQIKFLLSFVYIHCRWRPDYQKGRLGIPLIGLTPPHLCAYLNQNIDFQRLLSLSFL